jgi:hypothetical protein
MAIEKMARSLNDTSAARARFFEDAVFKNS